MLAKRLISFFKSSPKTQVSSPVKPVDEEQSKAWGRKAVSFVLITVTGGVALSALDDLAIYHGCSSKAIEKASKNKALIDSIGEPIVKGPWYNASLAVAHKRHSVSCTFPVSGPQGTGVLQLKAVRNGDDSWFSFLRSHDWDILIMDALLHVPGNEEKNQTMRITLADNFPPTSCTACTTDSRPPE
ncbi:Cytochrome oxidase assembly protein [Quillaja saponaria]|uniref:Cytochrome oxidase assembly protein n=1 Tax=Quillaja saponaria TaxID=32244 RepID=A0AAD7Q0G8_QUISA|nr:Cytochrome oxidase assembly protein [Quillaja saponaria]